MVDIVDKSELGFKTVKVDSDADIENIYQDLENNKYKLHINQYVVFESKSETDKYGYPLTLDCLRWTGNCFERVNHKGFTTDAFGKFKPYDYYQKAAMDSILRNELTCIKGKAGTGKSMISLHTAWYLVEHGKFDRLIIFTNPVKTKDAEALGFYKGTRTEKLLDSQIGIMLASKFGSIERVAELVEDGKLMLLPFSDIRGFDTSSDGGTIAYFCESQNLNIELLKLGLQRLGENTKGIVDGDPTTQVDKDTYKKKNGMDRMSEVFNGKDFYGEIELRSIIRSKIAKVAEEM